MYFIYLSLWTICEFFCLMWFVGSFHLVFVISLVALETPQVLSISTSYILYISLSLSLFVCYFHTEHTVYRVHTHHISAWNWFEIEKESKIFQINVLMCFITIRRMTTTTTTTHAACTRVVCLIVLCHRCIYRERERKRRSAICAVVITQPSITTFQLVTHTYSR